jgi:hypothetical protein
MVRSSVAVLAFSHNDGQRLTLSRAAACIFAIGLCDAAIAPQPFFPQTGW